jgi:hypothetical protein
MGNKKTNKRRDVMATIMMEKKMEDLANHLNVNVNELKKKTYLELEELFTQMDADEKEARCKAALESDEYRRLVKKYFTPFKFLQQWFSEDEIIAACANNDVMEKDLCDEHKSRYDKCHYKDAEFLRREVITVPRLTPTGRASRVHTERVNGYIYRIKAQYQGLRHAKVIMNLLYDKYPELKQF